ncbi:hypothetical protein DPMN_129846 [Dreissena polymorpha]|uniref:Uncharacterized protein n=2 Tax=Dreissena polymorpha TaxID=45954 RepID=A0A9D4JX19_DREPO|nr:hypothetical protein DPMN_129846 [Dreissena polymorpha]
MDGKEFKPVVTSWKNTKLSNPYLLKWPAVDNLNETKITDELKSVFSKHAACLRTIKKKLPWKKNKDGELDDKLSEEEENEKKMFRSKFVIGLQQVIRGLEKSQLGLVLISKDVQPAVLKASLLQMVAGKDCVAACVGGMYAAVKDAWKSLSSMAAFGVLKTNNADETFQALTKCVLENAPTINSLSEYGLEEDTDMPEITAHMNADCVKENVNSLKTCENMTEENVGPGEAFNPSKHYIMKVDSKKDFSGQSFIGFSKEDEHVVTTVTEFENGKRKLCNQSWTGKRQMGIGFPANIIARFDTGDGMKGPGLQNYVEGSNKKFKSGYRNVDLMQRVSKQDKKVKKKLKGKKSKK